MVELYPTNISNITKEVIDMLNHPNREEILENIFKSRPKSELKILQKETKKIIDYNRDKVKTLKSKINYHENRKEALDALIKWFEGDTENIQQNDYSRSHRLIDAIKIGKIFHDDDFYGDTKISELESAKVFVVGHDWSKAFGDALNDHKNTFILPFDNCLFEFIVNNRCVIVWASQTEGCNPTGDFLIELGEYWYLGGRCDSEAPDNYAALWNHVVAICVALDAEVATHEVIRAPDALNKKRERNGKTLLKDYHIVNLSKRHRATSPLASAGTHKSPRLHFRRGHWRHFETHKTWIKWMLVGNPSLGFINKHYRL